MTAPTVTDWLNRYKARMIERGVPADMAHVSMLAVDLHSGEDSTASLDESPEDAADDELSYWDADE